MLAQILLANNPVIRLILVGLAIFVGLANYYLPKSNDYLPKSNDIKDRYFLADALSKRGSFFMGKLI
ncbi:hypothetical protein BKE17_09020 [Enhydrobacter sp. H5]|nr:hypothetical protein BKE17_09020 [Enhydrobacter sp. H5]